MCSSSWVSGNVRAGWKKVHRCIMSAPNFGRELLFQNHAMWYDQQRCPLHLQHMHGTHDQDVTLLTAVVILLLHIMLCHSKSAIGPTPQTVMIKDELNKNNMPVHGSGITSGQRKACVGLVH